MGDVATTVSMAPLTRTQWADRLLRAAILSGELAPGQKLVAGVLAERWSLSPTPLREALGRLAEAGLVELTPQRGARVAAVSVAEAEEIYELRVILEPLALRHSFEHSDPDHVIRAEQAFERLQAAVESMRIASIADAHQEFHAVLLSQCPGTWLPRFCTTLSEHARRYQTHTPRDEEYGERTLEHLELLDLLRAGDTASGEALLDRHLRYTQQKLGAWRPDAESEDGDRRP